MNDPVDQADDDSILSIEDGLYFDIDTECGPDLTNWNDGQTAERDVT